MLLFILIFFTVVVNAVKYFHDNVGDEQSIIFIRTDQCFSDELEIWEFQNILSNVVLNVHRNHKAYYGREII